MTLFYRSVRCRMLLSLFEKIMVVHSGFTDCSSCEKLSVILGSESVNVIKAGAKICHEILNRRRVYLYR
jgi:hypothetical protein